MSLCATVDGQTPVLHGIYKLQEQLVQNRDMDRYGSQNKTILIICKTSIYSVLLDVVYQQKKHPFDTSDGSVPMPATKKLMWSIDQRRNVGDHTCEVRLEIYGWLVFFLGYILHIFVKIKIYQNI